MDFGVNAEQKMLIDSLSKFCRNEVEPLVESFEKGNFKNPAEYKNILRQLQPFGLCSGPAPEDRGGMGLDFQTTGMVMERLAQSYASLAGVCLIQLCAVKVLAGVENQSLSRRYLPALCAGEKIACVGITEPNVGSNPAFIETTLTRASGGYRLNGTKTWISNGSVSDVALVIASVDRNLGGKGLVCVLLDREKTPYQTRELGKLGLKGFPTSELVFEDILVPEDHFAVAPGEGLKLTLKAFELARALLGLIGVGLSRAAIEVAGAYSRDRKQFGKPIASFQMIQQMISDMLTRTDAASFLCYRAMWLMDQGIRCDAQSAMAKAYATEAAVETTSEAVQILGGYGLSEEYPTERLFRDARSLTIPDGTTQIQKLVVARDFLGVSAFA